MPSRYSIKSILQTLRQSFYIVGYGVCRVIFRPANDMVLFLSDSQSKPAGSAAAVITELTARGYRVEMVMRRGLRTRRTLRDHLAICRWMAQSNVILVDDFFPMIYQIRLRPGTQLLQLWHASGAFKTMGFTRIGKPGGPIKDSKTHKNYTAAIVSSESVRENYAQAFGIDLVKVHATGIPRTDPFFDSDLRASTAALVRAELEIPGDKKLLLFAPTFRGNGQLTATYDHGAIDWADFAQRFGSEFVIGIRMHPFVKKTPTIFADNPAFLDLTDYPDPNALLMATDLLVTDYSSIIFDYALLERPVIFFCPDLAQYTASRDFYYPFEDYTYGPVCRDYDELAAAVGSAHVDQGARKAFTDFFIGACDGHSTTRVVDKLIAPFLELPPERLPAQGRVSEGRGGESREGSAKTAPSFQAKAKVWGAVAIRTSLRFVYAPMKLLPARNKVTLISRQSDQPSIDFSMLAQEFAATVPAWQVKTLTYEFHSSAAKKLGYIPHVLTQMLHIATSRVVVVDTYCIPISALTHKRSLRIIQTWHAMGAIKKFAYSIVDKGEGSSGGITRAMHMHRNYNAVLTSSSAAAPYFAEAFGVPLNKMVVAPLPRVDLLTNPTYLANRRADLVARFPELAGGPNILFAPTFHKGQAFDSSTLETFFAAHGFTFIAKPHPVSLGGASPNRYSDASSFDLLAVADFVVTDYSSIMVEAAVADIPVFILAPDLANYRRKRSFYMDFEAEVPSPIAKTFEELLANIAAFDGDKTKLRSFANKYVELPTGSSCTQQVVRIALGPNTKG